MENYTKRMTNTRNRLKAETGASIFALNDFCFACPYLNPEVNCHESLHPDFLMPYVSVGCGFKNECSMFGYNKYRSLVEKPFCLECGAQAEQFYNGLWRCSQDITHTRLSPNFDGEELPLLMDLFVETAKNDGVELGDETTWGWIKQKHIEFQDAIHELMNKQRVYMMALNSMSKKEREVQECRETLKRWGC